MRNTIRLALLAGLLAWAPYLPVADAGGAHAALAPFSAPAPGALALYRVVDASGAEAEMTLAWEVESALVPGAEGRSFATLTAILRDQTAGRSASSTPALGVVDALALNPGSDYGAEDAPVARQRSAHVTAPGGDLLARTTTWFEEEAYGAATRGQWFHRVARAHACEVDRVETLLATVTGRRASAVLDAVRACGGEAEWRAGALHARFEEVVLRVVPVPGLPFPLSWTVETPDGTVEATLVGTRAGDPLASFPTAPALPAPARLGLVPWSAQGPATGELAEHPFREAYRAIAETKEGSDYFAQSSDARVLYATHVWIDAPTSLAGAAGAWDARIKGVPCGATEPTDGSATGEWTASWTAEKGTLFAIAQRVPVPGLSHGLERPITATRDSMSTRETGTPALLAPAPAELARHLRDLDAFVPTGVRSIDYAFVPTAQGNAVSAAAISRGSCERDPATGELAYVGTSLWFVDGEALAITGTTIHRAEPAAVGALLPALTPAPSPAPAPKLPPLTLWTGAAAVGALALLAALAARLFPLLYSRIHRGSALASEKRAAILEAIHRAPGAPLRDLAASLAMPVNTVEHHARVLRRLGYVRRVRTAAGVAYYASEHPRAPVAHVLDRAHADAVVAALAASPGCTQAELAERVGIRASHLSELLRDLEAAGLVERRRDGRAVRVWARARANASTPTDA